MEEQPYYSKLPGGTKVQIEETSICLRARWGVFEMNVGGTAVINLRKQYQYVPKVTAMMSFQHAIRMYYGIYRLETLIYCL